MFKNENNVINTKSVIFILIILFIILGFYIVANSPDINFLNSGMQSPSLSAGKAIRFSKIFLSVSLLFILISLLLMLSTIKKYNRNSHISAQFKDLTDLLQMKTGKPDLLSNNFANLYTLLDDNSSDSDFFCNLLHEIRTPVTVILGAIQLIEQQKPENFAERRRSNKHFHTIKQNCYRLLRLINNFLDITKLNSGYVKTNLVNCNIVYLVEEITLSVIPFSEQKRIRLEFDTESEEIITAVDIDKIERIILNLLSNAIKFTPVGGKIMVNVYTTEKHVSISVKDSGLGIPCNMQDSIFERFKQVNNSLTKSHEGSGIGLSIVKSFVELHGGHIKVISEENKGSEFIFEIPLRLSEWNIEDVHHIQKGQTRIVEAINIEFSDIYSIA